MHGETLRVFGRQEEVAGHVAIMVEVSCQSLALLPHGWVQPLVAFGLDWFIQPVLQVIHGTKGPVRLVVQDVPDQLLLVRMRAAEELIDHQCSFIDSSKVEIGQSLQHGKPHRYKSVSLATVQAILDATHHRPRHRRPNRSSGPSSRHLRRSNGRICHRDHRR
ncbi:hypothetical protein D3C78_1096870 [compost metagenome]